MIEIRLFISGKDLIYLESDTAQNDYYRTKLCFLNKFIDNGAEQINIRNAKELLYNSSDNEYFFPDDISDARRCFLLRTVIDLTELRRGNLPLHAAAVSDGSRSFIISAGSGTGKSYISDIVCRSSPDFYTIGDDHVIITSEHIQGNLKRRIRGKRQDEYIDNKGLDEKHALTFICYEFSETRNYVLKLSENDVFKYFSSASAFKYLNEVFVYNDTEHEINRLSGINVDTAYERCILEHFTGNNIIYICGTHKFAAEYILRQ